MSEQSSEHTEHLEVGSGDVLGSGTGSSGHGHGLGSQSSERSR